MKTVDKMFEYSLWANKQIIDICSGLNAEQLEVEVEGVFGTIQPTLVHLIQAEGGYLRMLTGSRPWGEDDDWESMSMAELKARAEISGKRLIEVAGSVDPATRHERDLPDRKIVFFNWTVVLQALYHGIEHRTQIKAMLTKLGVEHPDHAAWDYAESLM